MEQSITLLLVDDEHLIIDMLTNSIESGGFSVIAATDGKAALAVLDDDTQAIAGLITDINMGPGPDGWEIARRARECFPDLPVVYMTGAAGGEWASRGVPKSVLIAKPFAAAQVVTAIATLLNAAPVDSGAQ